MIFKEQWAWKGHIKIISVDIHGKVHVEEFDNLVMNLAKNNISDVLRVSTPLDFKIRYCALGSSNTAVAATQVQLVSEQFRQQVTQQLDGGTGITVTTTYVSPTDCNGFTINEIAWFAGTGATSTVNSGLMVARVLYNHAKTSLESLTIQRTDTFS